MDIWVLADPSQTYKLWVRMKAQNDSWANDSIFVQFEGGAQVSTQTRYAIGTTDALDINLEECSGCGLSGWGWRDERWGATRTSAPRCCGPDSRVSTRPDRDTRGRRVSRLVRAVSRAEPERTARTRKEGRDDSAAEALIARGQRQGQTSFDSATPATL